MVKKKEETKEVEVGNEVAKAKTFAIVPNGAGFNVIEVLFDPATSKLFRPCSTRDEAVETFKIEIAKTGMLG
jgi:hypothetical protein